MGFEDQQRIVANQIIQILKEEITYESIQKAEELLVKLKYHKKLITYTDGHSEEMKWKVFSSDILR